MNPETLQNENTPAVTGALKLSLDTSTMAKDLQSLAEFLDVAFQIRQGVLNLLDSFGKIGRINTDALPATGTDEFRALLEPTDGFADFMTAIRAGNVQLMAINRLLHVLTSSTGQPIPATPGDITVNGTIAPELRALIKEEVRQAVTAARAEQSEQVKEAILTSFEKYISDLELSARKRVGP